MTKKKLGHCMTIDKAFEIGKKSYHLEFIKKLQICIIFYLY